MIELYDFSGSALSVADPRDCSIDWNDQEKRGMSIICSKKFMNKKMLFMATVDFLRSLVMRIWDHIGLSKEQVKHLDKLILLVVALPGMQRALRNFFLNKFA